MLFRSTPVCDFMPTPTIDSLPIFSAVMTSRKPISFFKPSITFWALSKSGLSAVNEISVAGVPVPWLMFFWIVVAMLPVVCMLRNVDNVEFTGVTTKEPNAVPMSKGREYDLERDWDLIKAAGLASTYAIPFLAREDVVRARRIGHTCVLDGWRGTAWERQVPSKNEPPVSARAVASDKVRCDHGFVIPAAPHSIAMMFSTLQGILWILVAANLPAIARRRP